MALVTSLSSMRTSDAMTTDPAMTEKCKGNLAITISDMRKEFCLKRESDEVVVNFMQTDNSTLANPLSLLNKTKTMYDKFKPKAFPFPAYRLRITGTATVGELPAMALSTTCHVCGKPCRICGHPIADSAIPGPCLKVHVPKCPLGSRLLRVPKKLDDMIPDEDFTFPPIKLQLTDVTMGLLDLPEILQDMAESVEPQTNAYIMDQKELAQERKEAFKEIAQQFNNSKVKDVVLGEEIKADVKLSLLNPEGELVSATGQVLMATK